MPGPDRPGRSRNREKIRSRWECLTGDQIGPAIPPIVAANAGAPLLGPAPDAPLGWAGPVDPSWLIAELGVPGDVRWFELKWIDDLTLIHDGSTAPLFFHLDEAGYPTDRRGLSNFGDRKILERLQDK